MQAMYLFPQILKTDLQRDRRRSVFACWWLPPPNPFSQIALRLRTVPALFFARLGKVFEKRGNHRLPKNAEDTVQKSVRLVQQGYTIFECSTCHEQYKSSDGTVPPGGGSGTDPGGEDKETLWDKLGNLVGAIGSGVIGLIEAALGKVLDALIVLVEGMMERLKTVVEAVLSIFDELPKLFGGFLDFLVALFPFLPPELMTILTFGILAVVFIGIIKAVRR